MSSNTHQEKNYDLGNKIRNFRLRAGLSQFKLEELIDASPGSISRIENGEVNPTKETLSLIFSALKLSPLEITDLLDIQILSPEQLILAINTISNALDMESTLQTAVDIMFDLYPNYNGGVIFLLDNKFRERLYSKTVSNMPNISKALALVPGRVSDLSVSLKDNQENMVVRSIIRNAAIQSDNLHDFLCGALKKPVSIAIAKILGFKMGVSIPLRHGGVVIGAAFYTKRVNVSFSEYEIKILELFSEQIAISIKNSELIENLKTIARKTTNQNKFFGR